MSQIQFERKWIVQCEAARQVKKRFGLANALDYLIGEKLLTFCPSGRRYVEFSQELPNFLQEIRAVFSMKRPANTPSSSSTQGHSARFSVTPSGQFLQLRRKCNSLRGTEAQREGPGLRLAAPLVSPLGVHKNIR
jgi:hypothetical protein